MKSIEKVSTPDQIQQVAALAFEIWNQHFVPIIGQGQVDYMLDKFQSPAAITQQIDQGFEYYLLAHQSVNLGYLGLVPNESEGKMMISKFYISSNHRGQGYGNYVLDFVKTACKTRGIPTIWLTVNKYNENTIAWYKRKGFEVTEEVKADIGKGYYMDDYIMELFAM